MTTIWNSKFQNYSFWQTHNNTIRMCVVNLDSEFNPFPIYCCFQKNDKQTDAKWSVFRYMCTGTFFLYFDTQNTILKFGSDFFIRSVYVYIDMVITVKVFFMFIMLFLFSVFISLQILMDLYFVTCLFTFQISIQYCCIKYNI